MNTVENHITFFIFICTLNGWMTEGRQVPPHVIVEIMKQQLTTVWERATDIQERLEQNQAIRDNVTSMPNHQPGISVFRDCKDVHKEGYTKSGVYLIHVFHGFYSLPIYCDMDTVGAFSGKVGWMTIQRRTTGEVNFDRNWNDYLNGFGFPDSDHWIGLRNILKITEQKRIGKYDIDNLILRIDIEDWDGVTGFMEHSSFGLLSEKFDFEINSLGKYTGTDGLSAPLEFSASTPFSTNNHNNDRRRDEACVKTQKGGWWFGFCNNINLNGILSKQKEEMNKKNVFIRNWRAVNPSNTALRFISIKLQ